MARLLLVVVWAVWLLAGSARADGVRLHVEVDPLPFALGGYGVMAGARVGHWRGAVASFALDVPDPVVELGGNDGWHGTLRPSGALYVLYYLDAGREGWAFGGSLRFLRPSYTLDGVAGEAPTRQLSPELIAAYKWHPFDAGFYLQPWVSVAFTAWESDAVTLGGQTYDPWPVQLFATVNLGWELAL